MIVAIVLSALLVVATWVGALLVGLSLSLPGVVTAVAALAWAGVVAWRRFGSGKAAGDIESALAADAAAQAKAARPDQQAEIEGMQREFQAAVQALKRSNLGRRGRDALALLPWYLIIGPPGSGKSTALRASGLKFPYATKRGGVRGVGGTRNCEWWLTNEAVLLDTAGRYATHEEDHEEWMSFLDLLARTRPRKPLNGLVVAVAVSDVDAEETGAELGKRIRERVDEVMARLQLVLPVYLLFTKCDLLPGFVETFADLHKQERGQVWGFTLPLGEPGEKADLFRERFDELLGVVEQRALRRLAEERHLAARERIYEFPQQLEAVRQPLAAFLESLFEESVYQDSPILRGVYFTSGTQEGRAVDRVMKAMAQAFGIQAAVAEPEPILDVKSYFLRDVFSTVIVPDAGIASRSDKALRRDTVRQWALAGVAGAVALLALVLPLRSYVANRAVVRSTGELVDAVAARLGAPSTGPPPLAELEPLRARLEELVRWHEEGAPFRLRLGLYRGDQLLPAVRHLYAGAVRRLVVDPVFRADAEALTAFVRRLEPTDAAPAAGEHAEEYDRLKLHLLLTAPRTQDEPRLGEAEAAFVGRAAAERWASRARRSGEPIASGLVEKNARLFTKLLAGDPALALPRHEDLVQRARRILARLPSSTLAVDRLAAELDDQGFDVTLPSVLGGPVPALRASAGVRGAFTRRAYEAVVKARLDDPRSLVELWVVGGGGREGEERAARELERLRSRYYERYIDAWRTFVESVQVQDLELSPMALLQDLSQGEPPPLARIFRAVGYNTRLVAPEPAAAAATGIVERVVQRLGAAGVVAPATGAIGRAPDREERLLGPRDVERAFASFAGFGYAPEAPAAAGAPAAKATLPLDLYQEQLSAVREALQVALEGGDAAALSAAVSKARVQVETLVNARDVGWRPRLRSLLLPAVNAAEESRAREEVRRATQRWCAEVTPFFASNLAGRYPFDAESHDDASLGDVAAFFRPGSGILWRFQAEALGRLVQRSGDGFAPVRTADRAAPVRPELLQFLRRAQELTSALFPPGAAEPAVALSLRIRPTPRIAAVFLDLDGQRFEYHNGPEEWVRVAWPGKAPHASLRVRAATGGDESLARDGDWAIFRLLEAAAVRADARAKDFAAAFPMRSLGATVTIDFRPARSETPFFAARRGASGRFLEPFRGLTPPSGLGAGTSCGEPTPLGAR